MIIVKRKKHSHTRDKSKRNSRLSTQIVDGTEKNDQREPNEMWQNCMYPIQLIGFCSHVLSDTGIGRHTHTHARTGEKGKFR